MKKLIALAILSPSIAALGLGCVAGDESVDQSDEIQEEVDPEYMVTHVELHEDGSEPTVTHSTVHLSQQLAEHEREERLARGEIKDNEYGSARSEISKDSSCATTSLRIWAEENFTGQQICFSGTGHADIENYCQWPSPWPPYNCILYWGVGDVQSFKTGNTGVAITDSLALADNGCCSISTHCGWQGANQQNANTVCERDMHDVWRGGTAPSCCATGSSCPGVTPAPCP